MNCIRCNTAIVDLHTHGFHYPCFKAEFGLSAEVDFRDLFERASSAPSASGGSDFSRINSSFFHGKFRKYGGTLESKNYILKVQQADAPELPIVEYVSNHVARIFGIQVPDHHFILFKGEHPTFVTRNFMDAVTTATTDHIFKFLKADDQFDCETIIRIIQAETGRLSDVHRFVEICLFDSLIGNHDRHGRNLALITKSGGRVLSPFYDNPSYIGIADEIMLESDLQPRGTLFTHSSSEPLMKDYLTEFKRLGLESAVSRFKARVISKIKLAVDTISNCRHMSVRRRHALIKLIEKRMEELENG